MAPETETAQPTFREILTNALRYWEPRRLIYNAVLAAVVIAYFIARPLQFAPVLNFEGFLFLFLLAVGANIVYCAAYIADIFVQLSGFRAEWIRYRWVLFLLGLIIASIITHYFFLFTDYR